MYDANISGSLLILLSDPPTFLRPETHFFAYKRNVVYRHPRRTLSIVRYEYYSKHNKYRKSFSRVMEVRSFPGRRFDILHDKNNIRIQLNGMEGDNCYCKHFLTEYASAEGIPEWGEGNFEVAQSPHPNQLNLKST